MISLFGRGNADLTHFWRDVSVPITIIFVPGFVRIVRASVFATKNADYITAANTVGANTLRILSRHILPNIGAPILVLVSLNFGFAILVEATLSFLGLGTQPPDPSWGAMLASDGRRFLNDHPHLVYGPALVISVTVLAVNILGDTIRDALDPELRNR
jgi:peptide/nickel transport system permease protein